MKKFIKILVILFITILGSFNALALEVKSLNNETNIDVIKEKESILLLKTEIINEKHENDTYIRNYRNVLIKYSNKKEIFKINFPPKSVKSNKKAIYQMPKSFIYNDNNTYYVLENTDTNFFSITKVSSSGKIEYTKNFSGNVKNIKSITDTELLLVGGTPAFLLKIAKNTCEELQKNLEENPSVFNDFLVNENYFLLAGEDTVNKESLMIKYDFSLTKLFTMSLGYKEFTQIIPSKNNDYFLLGENNYGGILTKYSKKERILFQKDKDKNVNAKVLTISEQNDEIIIFTYLKKEKMLEISKYNKSKLISRKLISSDIEPYILKENNDFYIATNNKLYKTNRNFKTSYLNIKNITKIIKILSNKSSITIVSDKSINTYNKTFLVENIITYILIVTLILILIGVIYYIKVKNVKFNLFKKEQKNTKKIHTKLHNQNKEKPKNKNKKKAKKKHKKNKKK